MRGLLGILATVAVMGLAAWAYGENYRTTESIAEVERLQREIGALREKAAVLGAEWAYLNRPDRLRELVMLNFDRLALMPLEPEHFGTVGQAAYPMPGLSGMPGFEDALAGAVDTALSTAPAEQMP